MLTAADIEAQNGATMDARLLSQTAVTLDGNALNAIPEPASYASLLGLGALSLLALRRRTHKATA